MTPCEELGYEVGDTFVVSDESYVFTEGSIVQLYQDDGSNSPLFLLVDGYCGYQNCDDQAGAFDYLSNVIMITKEDIPRIVNAKIDTLTTKLNNIFK